MSRWFVLASTLVVLSCLGACSDEAAPPASSDDASSGDVTVDTVAQDATSDGLAPDVPEDVTPDVGPDVVDAAQDAGSDVASDTLDVPEIDAGPQPCDPPLGLSAATQTALPYGLLSLAPTGGTGDYRFTLTQNGSEGAMVHELLGSYLAGGTTGTQDIIELTDEGCIGVAAITIDVVAHMAMEPASVEVKPLTSIAFDFQGGSGNIGCAMTLAVSGGDVSAEGIYQAGADEGMDVVRCVDLETHEASEAIVSVLESAEIVASPGQIVIPMGSTYAPRVLGGSGHISITSPGEGLSVAGGELMGDAPGRYVVTLEDVYVGESLAVTVDVLDALQATPKRAGLASYQGHARTADIDGDGHLDAVLGFYEANVAALQSGAVYIFQGTETGLDPVPVRVLSGYARRDNFGRALTLDDFNGDGRIDLVVGADGYDTGLADGGALFVYYGIEDGFFEELPSTTLPSVYSYDHLGYSLTSCDFNGDGWTDLASGVIYAENRDLEVQPTNQGGAYVWLGSEDGFGLKVDLIRYGMLPDGEGGWTDMPNLQLGWSVVSGHMDDDGACELVVVSRSYSSGPGRSNDGAAFVYKGVPATDGDPGGLSADPHIAWGGIDPDDPASQLGRNAEMADVTGDGLDELLLAQYQHDAPEAASGSNHGTLRLFLGGSLPETATAEILSASLSDWKSPPANNGDQTGWNVRIGDVDGDDHPDLLVSALNGEIPDHPSNTGSIAVYKGVPGQIPEATPSATFVGELGGDTFGQTFSFLGDMNGDGTGDLFVLSGRNDELGPDVGRPYFVSGVDGTRTPLEFPGEAAGSAIGTSVAIVDDLDGDGYPEALVGAPLMEVDDLNNVQVGATLLYKGTETGFNAEPDAVYKGFVGHSASDQSGYDVAGAGDFDGDGHDDLAILARYDDQPNSKNAYSHDGTCGGSRSNPGSVMIFRGSGDGLPDTEPDFVWYGPQNGQSLRYMAAGLDINGDNLADFVAGGPDLDRPGNNGAGGFAVVFGRPQDSSGMPNLICANELVYVGLNGSDYVGQSITSLGDVNQDGCDDFAVGGRGEDNPTGSQGSIRVFFGWGGAGCPAEPTYVFLYPNWGGSQAGYGAAGGLDVTGDGVPDLLVGGPRLTTNSNTVGAAWLIPGDYIASLPTEEVVDGASPAAIHPFIPPSATTGLWRYDGETDDEWLGRDVALIPDGAGPGVAAMAIGSAYSDLNGVVRSGAVRIVTWDDDPLSGAYGFQPVPRAVMGGETWRTGARFGEALAGGKLGDSPVLLVGGVEASALGLDEGAAWTLELAP